MELLQTIFHHGWSFIVIISVIVFVHEFGHYYIAKLGGVKVDEFSIGFGPELFGWNNKSGTRWKVCLFPLGGYVKMFGDLSAASTPDKEKLTHLTEEEKKVAFHLKPLKIKAAVVAAGPIANYIFAIIILTGFYMAYGKPHTVPEVSEVIKDSAAEKSGLKEGDLIITLDNNEITRFEDLRRISSLNPDTEMEIMVKRGEETLKINITPKLSETKDIFGNSVKVGLLGIKSSKTDYEPVSVVGAFTGAVHETYQISASTLKAIGQIITGKRNADEISGILRIGKFSAQATEKGLTTVFWFLAVLSINLGLVNLFPIPVLDGGHLLYYTIEAVKGAPIADKVQEYGFRLGFAMLVMLMAFALYNDLKYFNLF